MKRQKKLPQHNGVAWQMKIGDTQSITFTFCYKMHALYDIMTVTQSLNSDQIEAIKF